ncbi:MAG: glucosamine-1-phosphate N-acetyltransferase [Ruminococcaceae bacterium]|jgi:bifunctional UDP-N-acetylglucosamine pyrophosphorylase/glucosamine-1-phosphate N-acetyltransferase|nr:glucosamine-1-phosphate N-acetyltransferase [Oscillospiraceae bacterium]
MAYHIALLDLRNGQAAGEKPLMLRPILFCPVLTWVCQELAARGVERFFVVCGEEWQAEAQQAVAAFAGAEVHSKAEITGEMLVIDHPVLPLSDCKSADGFASFDSVEALQAASPLWRQVQMDRLQARGVTVIDPANTYVDPTCTVESGVTLLPGTVLRGKTHIAAGCEIGPNTMIRDSSIGKGTTVNASQVNESVIGAHTTVGPFAYVRPDCTIGDGCRVGDFVEVKNSVIGDGTKISHLTYVGDSDVGQRVNFGCGTVTTNFDGHKKYRCTIGDDVFLGCNTNLIAPVTLGNGSYTAAGSTITTDVPADALAIARVRQSNKPGWAAWFRRGWKKEES